LAQTLIIRDAYVEKNNKTAELEISELQFLNRPLSDLNIVELRPVARQAGLVSTNPEDPENLQKLLKILDLEADHASRVLAILQGGIPHKVLNARKHDEESQIIAKAGAYGSVTIATNMAGRGVDIKLGGDLPEEILADVIRVLEKNGTPEPYDLSNDARLKLLRELNNDQVGIYEESVKTFIDYFDDMAKVRQLGGLHVIGSERHEARRIDNQLRGRAARQGDPGSSRFYLSLEDELMRLFGGVQMEAVMGRLKVDQSLPIESGLLGRMVEQAQERVEGNNFDVRKHLLEYDDVLNTQRKRIYGERNRTFEKDDLHDDVIELLRTELQERIPRALKDEEGPWKLLAFLEEVQPSMAFEQENIKAPSFTLHLLIEEIRKRVEDVSDEDKLKDELLKLASEALETEKEHILKTAQALLDKTDMTIDQIQAERLEMLENYFDGLESGDTDEGAPNRRPQELLEELVNLVHTPLRLSSDALRQLPEGNAAVKEQISNQITASLKLLAITRMVGALERRLEESLELRANQLIDLDWFEISNGILQATTDTLTRRIENLLAPQGPITQNINAVLAKSTSKDNEEYLLAELLVLLGSGTRVAIDPRTHQRGTRKVNLVNYTFLAAQLVQDTPVAEITNQILDHLEETRSRLEIAWGRMEYERFRLAGVTLNQLDQKIKNNLRESLGDEEFSAIESKSPDDLAPEIRETLAVTLGTRVQNDIYRHILVSVISELWVDYLTRVDALRVSIGLEAFAQRDPLVQYKSQAAEMFKNLLSDIRVGVINKMFRFQPRRATTTIEKNPVQAAESPSQAADSEANSGKKKRKRH
jgi:preprotein translocase subunit SecA